jgi:hypothetical protein
MNWYYAEGTQQLGPVSEADFQQLVASGKITDATLVWREGMAQWQPYGQVRAASPPGTATLLPAGGPGPSFTPAFTPLNDDAGARAARDRVNGPAIGLIATAVIGFVVAAGALLQAMLGTAIAMPPDVPPEFRKFLEGMTGALGFVNAIFAAALSTVILMGGLKLRKLQSFGLCIAAAIIALVPCISPCCCIGLPVGIWVLVVMNSADVKPYFD